MRIIVFNAEKIYCFDNLSNLHIEIVTLSNLTFFIRDKCKQAFLQD